MSRRQRRPLVDRSGRLLEGLPRYRSELRRRRSPGVARTRAVEPLSRQSKTRGANLPLPRCEDIVLGRWASLGWTEYHSSRLRTPSDSQSCGIWRMSVLWHRMGRNRCDYLLYPRRSLSRGRVGLEWLWDCPERQQAELRSDDSLERPDSHDNFAESPCRMLDTRFLIDKKWIP